MDKYVTSVQSNPSPNSGDADKAEDGEPKEKFLKTSIDNEKDRALFGEGLDLFMTLLGNALGVGNLWRFSYLCYDNGGGAFIMCYIIALFTVGIPMNFTELAMGQYFRQGTISVWDKMVPICKGIGIASTVVASYWIVYVMVIFAWTLKYFVATFQSELPWGSCDNWWNSKACTSDFKNLDCFQENNQTLCYSNNATAFPLAELTDPVREFWEDGLLQRTSGITDLGGFQTELVFYLIAVYIISYFIIFKGVSLSGKIAYVTALFPYFLIFVLLIRGATLPGAVDGMKFYIIPDFSKLLGVRVWVMAFSQVFYSYGVGFGVLPSLGSHNRFHHNSYRDSNIVMILCAIWSFVAGLAVFAVIGFMAHEQQKPVESVATSGTGLAFLVYPTAVLQMPLPQLWAALFFLMMLMVIIDSAFCCYEAIITTLSDIFPKQLKKSPALTTLGIFIVGFLAGLPYVTRGGIYIFELADYHAASGIPLMTFAFCECTAIAYIYGIDKFWDHLEEMFKFRPTAFWKYSIKYVTFAATIVIWIANVVGWTPLKYIDYEYPIWAHVIGWCITLSSVLCIPGYAIYLISSTPSSPDGLLKKIKLLSKPKGGEKSCATNMKDFDSL